jgi:hypothetical protein
MARLWVPSRGIAAAEVAKRLRRHELGDAVARAKDGAKVTSQKRKTYLDREIERDPVRRRAAYLAAKASGTDEAENPWDRFKYATPRRFDSHPGTIARPKNEATISR